MKKNKRFVLVSLLLALVLSLNINVSAATTKTVPKTLTVKEAVDYALKYNGDILKLKFSEEEMGYAVSGVRSGRKALNDMIEQLEGTGLSVRETLGDALNYDSYLLRNKITEQRLERQKKLLNKTYVARTEMVKLSVESAYYNVLIKKIEYDDAKRNLDVVKKQTEVGEIKLKYGTISEMDYKSLQISENASELTFVQAEYAYNTAKIDFNDMLGLPFDTDIELTSPLEISKVDIKLTEEKKKELRENDLTFQSATETYNTAMEDLKYKKAYYGYSSDEYKTAQLDAQSAEITYQNDKNKLEKSILSTYNNLDVLNKTVKIYADKKDLMNLALGVQNIRLKYGTATEDDVITASINYNTAVNDYYEMLLNYNMLATLYDKNIMVPAQ